MDPIVPYIAAVVGCSGLYLMLRPGPSAARIVGALLGVGVFAWLLISAASIMTGPVTQGGRRPEVFFMLFSVIAVGAAVRMITHNRPVYAALYFVMVVLSSAGLFLMLQAEFMA